MARATIQKRRQRFVRPAWVLLLASAVLEIGACGSPAERRSLDVVNSAPASTSLDVSPMSSTTAPRSSATSAELEAFVAAVGVTPIFATSRRFPSQPETLLSEMRSYLVGRLSGVSLSNPAEQSFDEAFGDPTPIDDQNPGSGIQGTLTAYDVVLTIEVANGDGAASTIDVPIIPLWRAGGDPALHDEMLRLVEALAALAPIGADVLVLLADPPATPVGVGTPTATTAVVFAARDGSLVGLDPGLGIAASTYWQATSLDELRSRLDQSLATD